MNETQFEQQSGTGTAPVSLYPAPEPDRDRQFISFALVEDVRDPYSGVPSGVTFTRNECMDVLADVDEHSLASIAARLSAEEVSTDYRHMLVSAVYHHEDPDTIANLDFFYAPDPEEHRSFEEWRGNKSDTHELLTSLVMGLRGYSRLGFPAADNYRLAPSGVQEQAKALITVSQMIIDVFGSSENELPEPLKKVITCNGSSMVLMDDSRLVRCLLDNYRSADEMMLFMCEHGTVDAEALELLMDATPVLREGAL